MDDLKLLRDFGAHLEHQPQPTLVRQRERLLSGARPRRRWPTWWTAGLVAVATAAAVGTPVALVATRHTAAPPAGTDTVDVSGARNVLVIGSDTREGAGNERYGPLSARMDVGQRSDTIMIVHLPADRGRAIALSVSRDTIVRIPRCGSEPARTDLINSAYAKGGVSCLRATLEKLTGLRLDHTVDVDFAGFKQMVDAVGGVTVKLPQPVDDRAAKLKLPAGESVLNGEQALGYVRLRHYGDGSDFARIKRQQVVALALLRKVQRQVIADPAKLRAFLGEIRQAVRTDLSLEEMYELGRQLQEVRMSVVAVPWQPHPDDRNRVQWKQPEAGRLFASLK
ncbi:LCP family protein [Nonomuraea gerenzanensis]|uniref:Cell envelope-associated transcriptional attenuator LytR-CpsA-Psr, subfamily A1 (As in PMID19099556) n=1 Tax=Nonomuraea gerenzanensis TaxID=93944 RepID=A0A1M4DYA4_9ACTN|nr:LCP family protein [Nonomuraea gerenzanensis]UBU13868.1 LCP family protein [Nonomuraea gerenzanensis]SBO91546.1 Cell envelope-associated transcriptional attenuator LytR-CpsA-Psr, subfamily A1 (as in PMID19099556) [Nonomuraea gerenzanensis]